MKKIIYILIGIIVLILGYSYYNAHSNKASLLTLENDFFELRNQSNIIFVGTNPWNSAWYSINVSCRNGIPYGFEYLPEDKAVEIVLREDCINSTISPETLDTLTKKKFSYVNWDLYFQGYSDKKYNLNEDEAKKIAKAPWEAVAISGFDKIIGKIFRNTKNPTRKGYEPTGNPEIYTTEDKNKCDGLWGAALKEGHEEEWKISADKVLKCYRDLPPLP